MHDWAARGAYVVRTLKATADASQRQVRALLAARGVPFTPYWSSNVLLVKSATAASVQAIAARSEVARITPRWTARVIDGTRFVPSTKVNAVEWGLLDIKANQVWKT